MNIEEFKAHHYLFDSEPYGVIYAFIDFANVRPWAKDFWPEENKLRFSIEIDIKKLAELCDWVKPQKKFFYYGYYSENKKLPIDHPDNVKHRTSFFRVNKAQKAGFIIKTKPIKMIPYYNEEGRFIGRTPKCNFDVEMTMDMLIKINKYDTLILFSGDSDFGGLLEYLKTKGKKIIIVSTRSRMSSELQAVADKFIPAESLKELLRYEIKNTSS